jgi:putative chitobiose transport system permease protein
MNKPSVISNNLFFKLKEEGNHWISKISHAIAVYSLLFVGLAIYAGPFLWLLSTSLKNGNARIYGFPPEFIPRPVIFTNYTDALQLFPFLRYAFNTIVISGGIVILQLILCSLAAYPLAKMNFRGKSIIFYAILATMIVPFHSIMIPLFLVCVKLGLTNTYAGLILPFGVDAFGVFLLRQAFHGIPGALIDAAKIDGASEWTIYTKIAIPLSKPALATVAILTFTTQWNEFLWPLIVLSNTDLYTLQLGVLAAMAPYGADWPHLAAACMLTVFPVIVFFLLLQRYFTSGSMAGALKI